MGNEGIYSVGKDMVKQNITFCQTESFASLSRVGLTRETLAKTYSLARLFIFKSCALHLAFFMGKLLARQSRNPLVHFLKHESSPISLTYPLQLNPHTYKEK